MNEEPTKEEEQKTAEIVQFPLNKIVRFDANMRLLPQYTAKEEYDKLQRFRHSLVLDFISHIAPMIFTALTNAGFNTMDVTKSKNAAMIIESLKAYMEKDYKIDHPFHIIAEEMFDYDEQTGKLTLNEIVENEEGIKNETVNVGNSEQGIEAPGPECPNQ